MTRQKGDRGSGASRAKSDTSPARSDFGPLLSPANSALLVVDPVSPPSDASAESSSPEGETAAALCRCAELAGIPVLVSVFGSAGEPKIDDDGLAALAGASVHARDAFNPWDGGDLVAALDGTERRRLILLGGWCEATVVMAALSALSDGYDAHVVVDCCPGLVADAADVSLHRLVQAGVVPVTRRQVIFEWLRHRPDLLRAPELSDLLAGDPRMANWLDGMRRTLD